MDDGSVHIDSCSCIDCQGSCPVIDFPVDHPEYFDNGYTLEIEVDTFIFDVMWAIVGATAAFIVIVTLSYGLRKILLELLLSSK